MSEWGRHRGFSAHDRLELALGIPIRQNMPEDEAAKIGNLLERAKQARTAYELRRSDPSTIEGIVDDFRHDYPIQEARQRIHTAGENEPVDQWVIENAAKDLRPTRFVLGDYVLGIDSRLLG